MQTYAELESGRFLVIADFEDSKHMELFQITPASPTAKCVLNNRLGRKETGTGCLLFTSGSPDDTIVIGNESARNWYLKRDWRDYDLLMMAVHSPTHNLAVDVTVSGGPPDHPLTTHASVPVDRGWNVIRLDLAQIGEGIPLDNVREIRLAVKGASKPVQVRVDDILLTGNRKDLFGDSSNRDAGLYVRRAGRRWKVGAGRAGADFEITFANGQIIDWYNMAADPYRQRNLLRGVSLGPRPVLVLQGTDRIEPARPADAVVVRSRIVEMNSVRAVVTSEWRFVDDPEAARSALDSMPFQRWVYTVYSSGQMYVAVEATSATKSWAPAELGLAVSVASDRGPDLRCQTATFAVGTDEQTHPAYATLRNVADDALVLYVVDDANGSVSFTESTLQADGVPVAVDSASLVALSGTGQGDPAKWNCHILLGAAGEVSDEEALARAIDYANTESPRLEVGSFAAASGQTGGGFDPASGCYVMAPDRGLVRFVLEGRRPRFSPAFKIVGTDNRQAWVYVDHLMFDRVARDAQGNLLFQLPTIHKQTLVEVLLRRPGHAGAP